MLKIFGVVGIASILAWAGAVVLAAVFARSPLRRLFFPRALGLALLGWGLALVNSHTINAIRPDRSARDAALPQAEAISRPGMRRAYGEVSPDGGKEKGLVREAPTASESPEPLYKQKGKQKRQVSGVGEAAVAGARSGRDAGAEEKKTDTPPGRVMPEADVILANRLDSLNLLAVRSALLLLLAVNGWEYFRRLNSAFDAVAPLPFASRWLDAAFPKKHAVAALDASPEFLRDYAVTAARKGENFLYLGPSAFPTDRLARWHVPWWRWLRDLGRVVAFRVPVDSPPEAGGGAARWRVFEAQPLTVLRHDETHEPFNLDFVYESLWFGRYGFAVKGSRPSLALLASLRDFLRERHRPRAVAGVTVNIIWDFDEPLPEELLKDMAYLCRETNLRLILRLVRFSPKFQCL